jgi:hypothetical protein
MISRAVPHGGWSDPNGTFDLRWVRVVDFASTLGRPSAAASSKLVIGAMGVSRPSAARHVRAPLRDQSADSVRWRSVGSPSSA